MHIANVGRARITCSVPVLLLVPLAVVFSKTDILLLCFISLGMHELAHAFMAHRLGCFVEAIEIRPFGFIARLSGGSKSPAHEAAIAAAGPMVSLLLAFVSAGIRLIAANAAPQFVHTSAVSEFTRFNLGIGALNLLPVLPLDGGRLAAALIEGRHSGKNRARGTALLCAFGVALGSLLAAAGLFSFVGSVIRSGVRMPLPSEISFLMTGLFIAASAAAERRSSACESAEAMLSLRRRLLRGESIRVNAVAMSVRTTVGDALRSAAGAGYCAVLVTDDALRTVGIADEGMLTEAVLRGETDRKLGELLKKR